MSNVKTNRSRKDLQKIRTNATFSDRATGLCGYAKACGIVRWAATS